MATADSEERNIIRKSGVVSFRPDPEFDRLERIQGAVQNDRRELIKGTAEGNAAILPQNPNQQFIDMMNRYSSGSGANSLGFAELAYKKQQDAKDRAEALEALGFARARDARTLGGYQDYYGGGKGSFNDGFVKLLGMITDQGKVSEQGVTDAYVGATKNINEGYDAASILGTEGFAALNQYLGANKNNPYAGMNASTGTAPDALSNYLQAYGVSDQPVQGQIAADQMQAGQGAANFGNLLSTLGALSEQADTSRSAESRMAQLLFNTGIGQDRAGYQSQASNAQAAALAQLQQAMFQSRFGVEGDRNSLANQLVQTIIGAGGGNPSANPASTSSETETPPVYLSTGDASAAYRTPAPPSLPPNVVQQLLNLAPAAEAQNTTAQDLLDQLNARRGR